MNAEIANENSGTVLRVENLVVHYGEIEVLHDISFEVPTGKIVSLIGCNGAGKTTILKTISGLIKPSRGSIYHCGTKISTWTPHKIVQHKICQVPEGRGIFLNLSVEENLDLGAYIVHDQAKVKRDLENAFELFPILKDRRKQSAGTLSGGEQQMLAIARALMSDPQVLLLDEPSLGLAPQIIAKIFQIIKKINAEGKTILLVEQNALQALKIAHLGMVLETGRIVQSGPAQELLNSDEVRKAYLGQ